MGAVSKMQIQYGCSFVTAYKTEGICQFVTKHKKELQEILHNKDRREVNYPPLRSIDLEAWA